MGSAPTVTSLEPLAGSALDTLQSLIQVRLQRLPYPDRHLRVELRNTATVGEPGSLVKVRRR